MKISKIPILVILLGGIFPGSGGLHAQNIESFKYSPNLSPGKNVVINENDFHGYTQYWHDTYTNWYNYGSLFKIAAPNVTKTILQTKVDLAEDMGVPGLLMQEGFMSGLLREPFRLLEDPSTTDLEEALKNENVLVTVDPSAEPGKILEEKVPEEVFSWPDRLGCHQYGATDLVRIHAFVLQSGDRKIFVISSQDQGKRTFVKDLVLTTKKITEQYDLHKGWFGVYTLHNSVTCTPGHPVEIMGLGMNEGCDWFVFDGYMDFLLKDSLVAWIKAVDLPVVTDVGATRIYGCKDYDGFQIQQMYTPENWVDYARKKGGYVFRSVYDPQSDPYHFDGYIATAGNKEQIDNQKVPFVLKTGRLEDNDLSGMVLFTPKGSVFSRDSMWKAIMDRREVGILGGGTMMGPARYRHALEMLWLDRQYLDDHFLNRISLETGMKGYDLQVSVTNTCPHPVSGTLSIVLPIQLKSKKLSAALELPAGSSQVIHFPLSPAAKAMDRTNSIAVHFDWNGKQKSTLAKFELPPAISVYRLLYGMEPTVNYPVTIHNFTPKTAFPVKVQVIDVRKGKTVFTAKQECHTPRATFKNMLFKLQVPAGNYQVKVSALDLEYTSQLGVGKAEGKPYAYAIDLNGDGVNEYRMENDSVRVTLLATGGRVIEYIVKSRNDNVLFKLWPEKPVDANRPFRKHNYYPYGGFEDFLGQASMETHKIYHAEIVKKEGDYVRVRMWADYFGNRLEKTFTLYGNTPLLEVRFALTFKNPEANVIGPQPMLALGKKHWTEDAFYVPEKTGVHEFRMDPDKYYGQAFLLKEGWNAGYDTQEDITFIGAFPVDQPLFLHMWQNHPSNGDSHYYYAEFQPWVPIFRKSTMYFSYYLWGSGGPWEKSLQWFREHNLITESRK